MGEPAVARAHDILARVPWPAYQLRRAADGAFTLDYASPRTADLFEIASDDISATALFGRAHPDDLPGLRETIERAARGHGPVTHELRIVLPGGRVRWIETSFAASLEPEGDVVFAGVAHDVTTRKQMEEDLHASQALTRQIIHEMPLAIAMFDRDMRYLAYSRAWLDAYGRGGGDLHGVCHYDLHPELPERWREVHRRGLAGEATREDEDPWVAPDGTTRYLHWEVHPWREVAGAIGGIIIFAEDVTERRRAADERLAAERRYRELVELAPAAVFAHRDRKLVLVNAAACRLFEASADALRGRSLWDIIPDEIRHDVERRLALLEAGETVPPLQVQLRTLAGQRITVDLAAAWVPDAQGGIILVVARDLRSELQAQRDLEEGAARLSAILESMMDGIVTVDESSRIVLTNPAAEKMFGYGPGELLGRSLDELVPVARRAAHHKAMRAFVHEGVTARTMQAGTTTVLEAIRADGSAFPTETTISKVSVGGRLLLTAIHRDIGPRLRMERALDAERERFAQLAEAVREVFWLTDAASDRLLYVSPAYAAIWGRACESALGASHDWLEGVHPDDRARVHDALPLRAEGRYDIEYRVVRPDGSTVWVHDRAFPVRDASGAVVRYAGVAEDVTARRSLQEQLRQTQRLESLALLAGGIAHDFNNLLTIITSAAEVMRLEAPALDDELVEDILSAGQRGSNLTRQLLAFTRQEVAAPRAMRVATVVAETERLLRRLIGEDIRLETHLAPEAALVKVDPGQWSQVIINLAVNARDAMPRGGVLRIGTRSLVSDAAFAATHPGVDPGAWEVLEITDDGLGMAPEVQARVFEPFFTTKERGRGTGLGLAVVYGVVRQSGGVIEVDSRVGHGTTFTIYLPATEDTPADEARGDRASARGRERILLVEDEEAVRRVAVRALRSYGYEVECAPDARSALEMVDAARPPALLVTDVVMPGLDGTTLAERMRERFPALKVLFTSGYIDETLSRRGIDRADLAFLQKPYALKDLTARVREVLDAPSATP